MMGMTGGCEDDVLGSGACAVTMQLRLMMEVGSGQCHAGVGCISGFGP